MQPALGLRQRTTNLGVMSSNLFGRAQCNQRLTSISQFSADLLIPTGTHSWAHMMSVWRRPRAHPASGAFDLSAVAAPPALTSFADLAFSLPRFPRCLKLFSALCHSACEHHGLCVRRHRALGGYNALRNQHRRSFDDPRPRGLRRRLGAKDVNGTVAGDRFGFGGRPDIASRARCVAPSSGQSGQPSRPTGSTQCGNRSGGKLAPTAAAPMRVAQATQTTPAAAPSAASAQPKPAPSATAIPPCDKPGGMGLARIVEIDTTGGPGFGFEHFKQYDFLRDKEVVLTFDDGPWPGDTPTVLKALADECLKATFFEIGKHAIWHPEITKQVIDAGMTVGTHTWSHKDLARNPYAKDVDLAEQEIEMGISAVHLAAADGPVAPFFRFPDLQHPPQLLEYLAQRNIGIFSTDIDSRDFKIHKPEQVIKSVMGQLEKRGKGIILMHDFQHNTAETLPQLLQQLKAAGYKVVHMVPKGQVTTISEIRRDGHRPGQALVEQYAAGKQRRPHHRQKPRRQLMACSGEAAAALSDQAPSVEADTIEAGTGEADTGEAIRAVLPAGVTALLDAYTAATRGGRAITDGVLQNAVDRMWGAYREFENALKAREDGYQADLTWSAPFIVEVATNDGRKLRCRFRPQDRGGRGEPGCPAGGARVDGA